MIKLKPVFHEKIWGGTRLREIFDYDIKNSNIGEAWIISAHANGDCIIDSGEFKGKTLSWLYENRRDLFGNIMDPQFPLLVKYIDAKDKLSIQVHPDDENARKLENQPLGKTEFWYIVDCENDSEIIIGHQTSSKEEMLRLMQNNEFGKLFKPRPIKKDDFFYIPAGTIHGICENTLILEIQQSSDTTYRLFDYNRLNKGQLRELHIEKSLEVAEFPHKDINNKIDIIRNENFELSTLVKERYFTVQRFKIFVEAKLNYNKPFLLFFCLSWNIELNCERSSLINNNKNIT